jgi:hypothetical protein
MNIFVTQTQFNIKNAKDGNIYYIDNENFSFEITLSNILITSRIEIHLLYRNLFSCKIYTSKGQFILDKSRPSISLIYKDVWLSLNNTNVIPFSDSEYKQLYLENIMNYASIGENIIQTTDQSSSEQGKFKMNNLIIFSASNYGGTTDDQNNFENGEGSIFVYKDVSDSYFLQSHITIPVENNENLFRGNFGKHMKVVNMGLYDLLVVLAPTKINQKTFENIGSIFVYSYRKNKYGIYYFFLEKEISLPNIRLRVDSTVDILTNTLYQNNIRQIDVIKNIGIVILFGNGNICFYDLRNLSAIGNEFKTFETGSNKIKFIRSDPNDYRLFLSTNDGIYLNQYTLNYFTSTTIKVIHNDYQLNNFGRIFYPYSDGYVVISEKDFLDYNLSYGLKKRITFKSRILSFDLTEINSRKYVFLVNAEENNTYIFNTNYELLANDMYEINEIDQPILIRWSKDGESIFIGSPNFTDLESEINNIGSFVKYDLFFTNESRNINDLFPDFNIENQILLEKRNIVSGNINSFQEQKFKDLFLVSNRSNPIKNIERIYNVEKSSGIVIELNYNVNNQSSLATFAKYFIYTEPDDDLLNSKSLYLGWKDSQMLLYNLSNDYQVHSYRNNTGKTKIILMGIGTDLNLPFGKRWNLIESEMSNDIEKSYFDISLNLYGVFNPNEFIKFDKIVHPDLIYFLIQFKKKLVIVEFFSKSIQIFEFEKDTTYSLFYVDNYFNLFYLNKDVSGCYLSIMKSSSSFLIENQKMDFTIFPSQILGQYYNQRFILLENYKNSIQVRTFDIFNLLGNNTIEFEELNISNTFISDKYIIDAQFYQDTIQKIIVSEWSERLNKIYQKETKDIYSLPTILKTKFSNYTKNYTRQLQVINQKFVHYQQYKIMDKSPEVFYNEIYQKYFQNNMGIFSVYQFYNDNDLIDFSSQKYVQLNKQNTYSFSKYIFYPEPNNKIQTYIYDKKNQRFATTEKGFTGGSSSGNPYSILKIYDVSDGVYDFVENTGDITGKLIIQKIFDKEIGFDSLDIYENKVFISELSNPLEQNIKIWVYENNSLNSSTIDLDLDSSQNYIYRSRQNDLFINTLKNGKITYFKNIEEVWQEYGLDFSSNIVPNQSFDITFLYESYMLVHQNNNEVLFVRNNLTNIWSYFGERIYPIESSHTNSFELSRFYFINENIEDNENTFLKSIHHIDSPIFCDCSKNFYICLDNKIFKIEYFPLDQFISQNQFEIVSFNNTGNLIYAQKLNPSKQGLFYLPSSNSNFSSIVTNVTTHLNTQNIDLKEFIPEGLSNIFTTPYTISNKGVGFSKKIIYTGTTLTKSFETDDFPLIDQEKNLYLTENQIVYRYDLSINNTYLIDSSKNLTNFEMVIQSDKKLFTDSKFSRINYKDIQYQNSIVNFHNNLIDNYYYFVSVNPNGSQFLIETQNRILFYKENINNYPDKYNKFKSIPISNSILENQYADLNIQTIDVDWNHNKVIKGYGKLAGATGETSYVSIYSWDLNNSNYEFDMDISGDFSFGYNVFVHPAGEYLIIGEPKAKEVGEYKEGKIHIYKWNNNKYEPFKILRSKLGKIGYNISFSFEITKIATFNENNLLVIFSNPLTDNLSEIYIDNIQVYETCFVGRTDDLFLEETINYVEQNSPRKFYLIQDLNQCSNIITKLNLQNTFFNKDNFLYSLKPFGDNYILMIYDEICNIFQIDKYKMNYVSSYKKDMNSKVDISLDGTTFLEVKEKNGKYIIHTSW